MLSVNFSPSMFGLVVFAMTIATTPVQSDEYTNSVVRGKELAQLLCQRCHAIAGPGPGKEEKSPPFSTLIAKLTLEGVADQLLEGLPLGHDPMPKWQFSEQQAEDLLFYIDSVTTEN